MSVCYYVKNVTRNVNSTLHMVGTMGNSYKPHPTCRAKEMGTLTDWEVVEGPQIRVEGEVLQR